MLIWACILPTGGLLILLVIMLGWGWARVFLDYLRSSLCDRHLVLLILLFLIRCIVAFVKKIAVFEFVKEPWPGLNDPFVHHPLGSDFVGLLCGRILQRPFEGWDASIAPGDNVLVVFVLIGCPLIAPLVLGPEMVLPYARVQEVLRSLAMRAVISGEIGFLVKVVIKL